MVIKFFRFTAFALLASVLIASCKDDDDEETEDNYATMSLDVPLDSATIDMRASADGLYFKWWRDADVSDYILELSDREDFSNIIFTTHDNILTYTWDYYEADEALIKLGLVWEEETTLYWRVRAADTSLPTTIETRTLYVVRRQRPPVRGEWLFDSDDLDDLGKATTGNDLELRWATQNGATKANQFALVEGPSDDNKAVRLRSNGWFVCRHDCLPDEGSPYVSRYSILFDVRFGAPQQTYKFLSCTSLCWDGVGSDDELPTVCSTGLRYNASGLTFDNLWDGSGSTPLGQISLANATYADSHDADVDRIWRPQTGVWYRIVLSVDLTLATPEAELWVDGVCRLWPTLSQQSKFVPDLAQCNINLLPEGFILLPQMGNGSSESSYADIAQITLWNRALTEAEIKALSTAGVFSHVGK